MNNISLKAKLRLILYLPIVLFIGTTLYLLSQNIANIDRLKNSLYESSYKITYQLLTAERDMYQANANYQRLQGGSLDATTRSRVSTDLGNKISSVESRTASLLELIKKNRLENLADARSGETVIEMYDSLVRSFGEWSALAQGNVRSGSGANGSAGASSSDQSLFDQASLNLNSMRTLIEQFAIQEIQAVENEKSKAIWTSAILLAAEVAILLAIGIVLTERIRRTIKRVLAKLKQVAAGDLQYAPAAKYDKDELGQIIESTDRMTLRLRELIGDITDHSSTVSESAESLSASAKEAADGSEHVARAIQDVTSQADTQTSIVEESGRAMAETAIGIQRIAENTSAIAESSQTTSERIDRGSVRVRQMNDQLGEILASVHELSRVVSSLQLKSEQIGKITSEIGGIASRTNILSLNATIEAARAGEGGRGFAVVAGEIRALAAGSLESAEAIHSLIRETQEEIVNASTSMTNTLEQTDKGSRLMNEVDNDFQAIRKSVEQVSQQVHEASAVTEQIAASSEQVAAGMDQTAAAAREVAVQAQSVAAATEEQAALADSIRGATERLQEVAERLNRQISLFKL
ncbi:methyl-accepting chemotaxis protein [Cohnella thailandensis]|uniref:Methyl-accepting chemotaxis protein n=1 Tax=Cohnella thailandensis TaxID=557557 RepID=A0A841T3G4_9BACL|nr:methyl-accepting chemotaxis protein [Cohnella thailandensis]MBB6635651.1 methyl-accepting chemotaxis protein [Cohnella thailandensis]MBP1976027.1 methyl-accepting chemotaxis protein [Cohnella thailandensis]